MSVADGKLVDRSVSDSDEDNTRKRKHTDRREKHSDHKKHKSEKHKANDEQVPCFVLSYVAPCLGLLVQCVGAFLICVMTASCTSSTSHTCTHAIIPT